MGNDDRHRDTRRLNNRAKIRSLGIDVEDLEFAYREPAKQPFAGDAEWQELLERILLAQFCRTPRLGLALTLECR